MIQLHSILNNPQLPEIPYSKNSLVFFFQILIGNSYLNTLLTGIRSLGVQGFQRKLSSRKCIDLIFDCIKFLLYSISFNSMGFLLLLLFCIINIWCCIFQHIMHIFDTRYLEQNLCANYMSDIKIND